MPLLKARNPLAYPGGPPGFNPTHAAAPGTLISTVIVGHSAIEVSPASFVSSRRGTLVGAPTFGVDGGIGPSISGMTTAAYISFTGPAQTATSCTFAAIVYTAGGANSGIFGLLGTPFLAGFGGDLYLTISSGNDISSGIVLTAGTWFVAASFNSATTTYTFVARNLHTGAIQTNTQVLARTLTTGSTTYAYGYENEYSDAWPGKIAAAMHSTVPMALTQLVAWAQAPWDFWYPPTVENIIALSLGKGASSLAAALLGRAAAFATLRAAATGVVPVVARAEAISTAKAAPTGAVPVLGKAEGQSTGKLTATLAAALQGKAATQGAAKAAAAGTLGLLGRAATAVTGRAVYSAAGSLISLLGRATTAGVAKAKASFAASLSGRGEVISTGRAAPIGVVGLLGRAAARATGTAVYSAFGSLVALLARASGGATARAAATFAASLAGRTKVSATGSAQPRGTLTLTGHAAATGRGAGAATYTAGLIGRTAAQARSTARAGLALAMSGRTITRATARSQFSGVAVLTSLFARAFSRVTGRSTLFALRAPTPEVDHIFIGKAVPRTFTGTTPRVFTGAVVPRQFEDPDQD